MGFTPLLAMGTIVFTIINFIKYVTNKSWGSVTTQVSAWVAGLIVVPLMAQTDWASGISFGNVALSRMNLASQIVIGLLASSLLSTTWTIANVVSGQPSAAQLPIHPGLPVYVPDNQPPAPVPAPPPPPVPAPPQTSPVRSRRVR